MADSNTAMAAMLAGDLQLAADSVLDPSQASQLMHMWPSGGGGAVWQSRNWQAAHFQSRPDYASPAALQDLRVRRIALVVLTGSTKWSRVRQHADRVAAAVASATPGSYSEVEIPLDPKPGRA